MDAQTSLLIAALGGAILGAIYGIISVLMRWLSGGNKEPDQPIPAAETAARKVRRQPRERMTPERANANINRFLRLGLRAVAAGMAVLVVEPLLRFGAEALARSFTYYWYADDVELPLGPLTALATLGFALILAALAQWLAQVQHSDALAERTSQRWALLERLLVFGIFPGLPLLSLVVYCLYGFNVLY